MGVNGGEENIQELVIKACEIFKAGGGKLIENLTEGNYEKLVEVLNKKAEDIPKSSYHDFNFWGNKLPLITIFMVRNARMYGVNNPKRWFRAILNFYVYGSIEGNTEQQLPIDKPENSDQESQIVNDEQDISRPPLDDDTNGDTKKLSATVHSGPEVVDDTKKSTFPNNFYENIGVIALIVASALGILLVLLSKVFNWNTSVLTETLNILVLFSFFLIINSTKLSFSKPQDLEMFANGLNITETAAKSNIDRVNKIIAQLCDCIRWFIIFLLLFYFFNLLEDINPNHILDRYDSQRLFTYFFENLLNAISAAFIYLGFKILSDKTLDEYNNTRSYYMGTLLFLLTFTISYAVLLLVNDTTNSRPLVANYYNLVCGIYNGWAMILLFGMLIFMEFHFKDIKPSGLGFSKQFFHYGTLYILPLYALANCLYGVQKFEQFPELKSLIFFVCFIGKAFFLLFIYHYIKFRWLHIYIHIILADYNKPRNIIDLIKRSENS